MNPLAVACGAASLLGTGCLLRRMRGEFERAGRLDRGTTAAMYAAYGAHAAVTAVAAARRTGRMPPLAERAAPAGAVLAAGGVALCLAGMRRFGSARQISGTETGELAIGGVYRWSRNPQYTGYVGLLAGVGLARRSAGVLGLAAAAALVFRWWVPVEERHLSEAFGVQYERYTQRTARWLGPQQRD